MGLKYQGLTSHGVAVNSITVEGGPVSATPLIGIYHNPTSRLSVTIEASVDDINTLDELDDVLILYNAMIEKSMMLREIEKLKVEIKLRS